MHPNRYAATEGKLLVTNIQHIFAKYNALGLKNFIGHVGGAEINSHQISLKNIHIFIVFMQFSGGSGKVTVPSPR